MFLRAQLRRISMSVSDFKLLTEVADELHVRPALLSYLFGRRQLDWEICPLRGRCRFIPVDYIAVIRERLKTMGKLPATKKPRRKRRTANVG
jgi:hypothetical protein